MKTRTVLAMAALLCGCGAVHQARRMEGHFHLAKPGEGWKRVRPGGADKAWYNAALSATIYADSNCGVRFEDGELSELATHLTFGIARGEPLEERGLVVDGREGLLRIVRGSLDGVAVQIAALVLKKDRCVYDMVYVAPPSVFDQGMPTFEAMVRGFTTQRR